MLSQARNTSKGERKGSARGWTEEGANDNLLWGGWVRVYKLSTVPSTRRLSLVKKEGTCCILLCVGLSACRLIIPLESFSWSTTVHGGAHRIFKWRLYCLRVYPDALAVEDEGRIDGQRVPVTSATQRPQKMASSKRDWNSASPDLTTSKRYPLMYRHPASFMLPSCFTNIPRYSLKSLWELLHWSHPACFKSKVQGQCVVTVLSYG